MHLGFACKIELSGPHWTLEFGFSFGAFYWTLEFLFIWDFLYLCCIIFAVAMDLLELLFAGFMIYLLYKLVFGLIMPVSRAASQMKSKMNDFNRMQQEHMRQQASPPPHQQGPPPEVRPRSTGAPSKDDYIDFEEVK